MISLDQNAFGQSGKKKSPKQKRMPPDPHHCKNKICSYVLKLEGDEHAPYYIYCGMTSDIEQRMLAQTGIRKNEQASFCKLHPPVDLLSVKIHESEEEAILAECANYNLWAGKLGDPERVRGGRINGLEMPFAPRGWPRDAKNRAKIISR